jgi:hypothetical protein
MNNNYPEGADANPFAPWHQEEPESEIVDVVVTQTFSKVLQIEVDDYKTIKDSDEDGIYFWNDYSECNLPDYVNEQHLTIKDVLNKIPQLYKEYTLLKQVQDIESPLYKQDMKLFEHQLLILSEACKDWQEEDSNVELY